jgi:autotransporter-associated beta strand protein
MTNYVAPRIANMPSRLFLSSCVGAALVLAPRSAAQIWTGATSGNWSNAGNWSGGVPASGNNTVLNFATTANAAMTDDLTGPGGLPFQLNAMTFLSGAPSYSLTGNSLSFVNATGSVGPSIVMNSPNNVAIADALTLQNNLTVNGAGAGTLALNGSIGGNSSLTMSSSRTLTLGSNNNSYSGGTFVTSGRLLLTNGLAIPGVGNVSISNTGTFDTAGLTNFSAVGTVSISGTGKFAVSTGSGTFQITSLNMTGGSVDMTGSNGATLEVSNSGTITTNASSATATWIGPANSTIKNNVSGGTTVTVAAGTTASGIDLDAGIALIGNTFTKTGAGTMRLTSLANTASFMAQGGILRVDDASSNGGIGAFGTGALALNGGYIAYGGNTTATTTKPISLGANGGGISILSAGTTWALNGVISQSSTGSGLNVNGFSVSGSPTTLVFNGNNTFTQLVLIHNLATLQVPSIPSEGSGATGTTAGPLGQSNNAPGNILLGDGGNGGTVSNGRGTLLFAPPGGGTFTTDRGVTTISQYANNGGGAIGVASATSLTMTGQVAGQGALVKTGSGTLTLTNTSDSFAGGLYVENGTLNIGASGAVLPANCNVTVAPVGSGATSVLQVGYSSNANSLIGTLTLNNGTFNMTNGSAVFFLNQLDIGSNGGTVNVTPNTSLGFDGPNAGINATGNGSINGGGFISHVGGGVGPGLITVTVGANATLTSSAAFSGGSTSEPIAILGAGTLHLTCPTNAITNYTVVGNGGFTAQGRVQVDDLSVGATFGDTVFGSSKNAGFLTLNGGTLAYSGPSQTTSFPITLGNGGGTVEVTNATTNLSLASPIGGMSFGLTKAGPGNLTLTGNTSSNSLPLYQVTGGTLSVGAAGAVLPAGTYVLLSPGSTLQMEFTSGDNSTGPINVTMQGGGTFRVPAGNPTIYLNGILANKGTIDLTGSTGTISVGQQTGGLKLVGTQNPLVAVYGNSTWTGGTSLITNGSYSTAAQIYIAPNVTLSNNIPLCAAPSIFSGNNVGFQLVGGGTLYLTDTPNSYDSPLTVTQGRVRVDDLSVTGQNSMLGATGFFTLDGGTLQYGGGSQTTAFPMILGPAGGTIEVSNPGTTLTLTGTIGPPVPGTNAFGALAKNGPGTLILSNPTNNFASGIVVNAGTLSVGNDNQLGLATVTINPAGTVLYTATASTSRIFNMNNGTLATAAGVNLFIAGAVNGGYLAGPGAFSGSGALSGVTLAPNASFRAQGATFTNTINGGNVTTETGITYSATAFTRFTNQGSGTVIIGADGFVPVADFQSYGMLTVNPSVVGGGNTALMKNVGTTPLYFNGGSRTFVGTPATAISGGSPTFVAGIDLNGNNAIVAGGLFVNNGYIVDSSSNGTGTIVADFGSLVKGAGFYENSVQTVNGGKFQAGNSPGAASFGKFVFGPGGVSNYVFAINDATGEAGPTPDVAGHVSGWGLIKAIGHVAGAKTTLGDFTWTATPADKLTVSLETLLNPTTIGVDVPGMMDHFDPSHSYSWPAVVWSGTYAGPADDDTLNTSTTFDTSGFANPLAVRFGWTLDTTDHMLSLNYTPMGVPEPGSLALLAAAAGGWFLRRRVSCVLV